MIDIALLLTAVFAALQATGVIEWGWFWVLGPVWASIAIYTLFWVLAVPFAAAEWWLERKARGF